MDVDAELELDYSFFFGQTSHGVGNTNFLFNAVLWGFNHSVGRWWVAVKKLVAVIFFPHSDELLTLELKSSTSCLF